MSAPCVSAGVVSVEPTESLDEAIACADALLYQAKHAGRARVVAHASSSLPSYGVVDQRSLK